MQPPIVYPLDKVLEIKENRVKEQEKVVAQKQRELALEEEKLVKAEEARRQVQKHYDDKLAQMRYKMDTETTSIEMQQMRVYLKLVRERLIAEDKKVEAQKAQVELAKKNLEVALGELRRKRQEVDKLQVHKKDWLREMEREQERVEGIEQDEMGSLIFLGRHHRS